jgi:hypothetical protein
MLDQHTSQITGLLAYILASLSPCLMMIAAEPPAAHPLHQAAADGDLAALKKQLDGGVKVDLPLETRISFIIVGKSQRVRNPVHLESTALHIAAARRSGTRVKSKRSCR